MADAKNPIPSPQPGDSDDVELALETAQRMYKNGDLAEALKWLRRAASAAEEAGDDMRQLQLARLAADLAAVVNAGPQVLTSAPSIMPATRPSSAPSRLPQPPSKHPPPAPSARGSVAPGPNKSASVAPGVVSSGPPPLPSKSRPTPPGATPPGAAARTASDSQAAPPRVSDSQAPPPMKPAAVSIKPKPAEPAVASTSAPAAVAVKPAVSVSPSAAAAKAEKAEKAEKPVGGGASSAAAFVEVKTQGAVRVAVRVSARDENLYIVRPLAQGQRLPAGSREARLVFE